MPKAITTRVAAINLSGDMNKKRILFGWLEARAAITTEAERTTALIVLLTMHSSNL
jgi:hypothetical protein